MTDIRKKLSHDIRADADSSYGSGRRNHISDIVCSIGTIVFSFLATAFAAFSLPAPATAIAAGLATLCATLQRVVDFRGRASWYFWMAARLRQLERALTYEDATQQDVSQRLGKVEVEGEELWGRMVQSGGAAPTPRAAANGASPSGAGD